MISNTSQLITLIKYFINDFLKHSVFFLPIEKNRMCLQRVFALA